MSLVKRLRTFAAGLMLSAATISCVTTTPWQSIGTESNQIGAEKTVTRNIGTRELDTKIFAISNLFLDGETYKVKVTNSLERESYNIEGKRTVKKVEDIAVQKREEQRDFFNPILVSLGTAGGMYTGAQLSDQEGKLGGALLGGLVGFIGSGLLAGLFNIPPITTKTETRKLATGTRDVSSGERTEDKLLSDILAYADLAARNVKVGRVGSPANYLTDSDGILSWVYNDKDKTATRKGLENKLYDIPLVKEIKPETRERLRERLLAGISEGSETMTLETREQSTNPNLIIKNCTKIVRFDYFQLKDEAIYKVVQLFVEEEINSSLKTIEFIVKDDLTHVPIKGTSFEFSTDSPSKADLLGKYFTGGLKIYSERFIPIYLFGNEKLGSLSDTIKVLVYSPSNIFLEVTHPEYNFVFGDIAIKGDTKRTVYMVDKGSKVRLQNSEEVVGRIEE